jgi:DNA-binding response OmpR family regulator
VSAAGPGDAEPGRPEFAVDPTRFEARYGAARCFLGNGLEFRLLARLLRARGQFVSVHTLRDDVWGDDHTEKNTIQRTVGNLRRKLRTELSAGIDIEAEPDHYRLALPHA